MESHLRFHKSETCDVGDTAICLRVKPHLALAHYIEDMRFLLQTIISIDAIGRTSATVLIFPCQCQSIGKYSEVSTLPRTRLLLLHLQHNTEHGIQHVRNNV